ncbi:MAG: hypothetical protein AAGK47_10865 [Bacteroidota bacterium]
MIIQLVNIIEYVAPRQITRQHLVARLVDNLGTTNLFLRVI